MANKTVVHVVGTGTIGEPLIGLFTKYKEKWGIDEVTFHKRTPKAEDRAMVEHLIGRGGKLVVDEHSRDEFNRLGHRVTYVTEEALEREVLEHGPEYEIGEELGMAQVGAAAGND